MHSRIRVSVGLLVLVALVWCDRPPARAQGQAPIAEFVAEIRSGSSGSGPGDFEVFQNALYFSANDGVNGDELWRLDINGAATLVADISPGTCDVLGETAVEGRLAGRVLTAARLDDVAHDAFVDECRIDPGPGDRLADDHRAELRRGELLERAKELTSWGADG